MINISTKTGDKGTTGLANGMRIAKDSQHFEVIGTLDELNSWLGLVVVSLENSFTDHQKFLVSVQDTLFYIGAEVALSPKAKLKKSDLTKLENQASRLQKSMKQNWHTQFLLPGGTKLGAWLDIARSVCRRCERELVKLNSEQELNPMLLKYLNRLSDYLYIFRCYCNAQQNYSEKKFVVKQS